MTATLAAPDRVRAARDFAAMYRRMGYQPLPSDPAQKKPLIRFADHWEAPLPYDPFERFETTNIQVMTGRAWDLAVLDLDGPEAVAWFDRHWSRQLPPTWTVWHSKSGRHSRHHWFRLPPGLPETRKRVLWAEWDRESNGWAKHKAVELLCDRSLIMAPPSIHPRSGNPYGFAPGRSPRELKRPALLPAWVLSLPPVSPPEDARPEAPAAVAPPPPLPGGPRTGRGPGLAAVLDAVHDKAGVAAQLWGLKFAHAPQQSGEWVSVHDPFREDSNPSARFSVKTGGLWRPGEKVIPFCMIPVALGVFTTWQEAADDLAARFHVR